MLHGKHGCVRQRQVGFHQPQLQLRGSRHERWPGSGHLSPRRLLHQRCFLMWTIPTWRKTADEFSSSTLDQKLNFQELCTAAQGIHNLPEVLNILMSIMGTKWKTWSWRCWDGCRIEKGDGFYRVLFFVDVLH